MSAGGLTAAGGFLQGFAQSYNAARIRATQQDLDQRHQMAGVLAQLYPNARPEAQADIAQRLMTLYTTPPGKKMPKGIGDVTTLGEQQLQQNALATAKNVQGGQTAAFGGAQPQPGAGSPLPQPPGGGGPPPPLSQLAPPGASNPMAVGGPPATPAIPPHSFLLSPEERNAQAAATITATEGAKLTAENQARRNIIDTMTKEGHTPGEIALALGHQPLMYRSPVTVMGPNGEAIPAMRDPYSGQIVDQNGNVMPNAVEWKAATAPGTSAWKTFYAAGKAAGQDDKAIVGEWNTRESNRAGFIQVQQPDGSIKAIPITSSTTSKRGIPPPPSGTGRASVGTGQTVGGKLPPEVVKDQAAYQDSVSRFNVMSEALPEALNGNQQAMINLLYNHIGMTVGLQKGARITQDIIDEAQKSAPWMSTLLARIGVGNEFTMSPELLRGVVITPQQMHQMVGLAEGRVEQDWRKYQQTQTVFAGGAPQGPESGIAGGRKA